MRPRTMVSAFVFVFVLSGIGTPLGLSKAPVSQPSAMQSPILRLRALGLPFIENRGEGSDRIPFYTKDLYGS